jgi:hypothetical protein
MHTVEMLESLETVAAQAGYTVRHEWLGGTGGGACEFAGKKWIFVDLSLPVPEQLAQIAGALKTEPDSAPATSIALPKPRPRLRRAA